MAERSLASSSPSSISSRVCQRVAFPINRERGGTEGRRVGSIVKDIYTTNPVFRASLHIDIGVSIGEGEDLVAFDLVTRSQIPSTFYPPPFNSIPDCKPRLRARTLISSHEINFLLCSRFLIVRDVHQNTIQLCVKIS